MVGAGRISSSSSTAGHDLVPVLGPIAFNDVNTVVNVSEQKIGKSRQQMAKRKLKSVT